MKRISVFIVVLAICATSFSQTGQPIDFSGSWKLKTKDYISGPKYSNLPVETYLVEQKADSLIITIPSGRSAYSMNGSQTTTTSPITNRKSVLSLKWSPDAKTVTLTQSIYMIGSFDEVELTRVQTWNLSAYGKQLLIDLNSIETRSESWEVKEIYEKQ